MHQVDKSYSFLTPTRAQTRPIFHPEELQRGAAAGLAAASAMAAAAPSSAPPTPSQPEGGEKSVSGGHLYEIKSWSGSTIVDAGSRIVDVWADNLEEEFNKIRMLIDRFPYIAMDTEFPGVVARPLGTFRNQTEYLYQTLRCNVNLLKIIQLGLTFSDNQGHIPDGICTWQFNFKWSLSEDMYAQDSIDLLTKSGIDFRRHEEKGIDIKVFGELLISSGFVLNDEVRWISFHSGYDFGYLLKTLTCLPLPAEEKDFFDLLHTYFPYIYDIKYLMKSCETLKGGLNQLAEDLEIERIGPAHQAGSDSLLTCVTFFKMMRLYFENNLDDPKFLGILFGLGAGATNALPLLSNPM